MFDRFAARLSYVSGDFTDAATYERLAAAVGDAQQPGLLPGDPAVPVRARDQGAQGRRPDQRRPAWSSRSRSATTCCPRARSPQEIHQYIDESQLYRIDHFLGKMGTDEFLYLRFANTMIEPIWNRNHIACVEITMAEDFGVEDRGHFYDPVGALRDVVVNHLMQVVALAAMEAPAGDDADTLKDAKFALFRSIEDAEPAHYVRGQYDGYLDIDGVAKDSTTETYAAMRLDIDNWRWSGVPWFIRTGKRLPATQTELRAVFRDPPRLGFMEHGHRRPEPNQFVVKLDPSTGTRVILDAHRADAGGAEAITLDVEFAEQGGEAPTPYEVLLLDAMRGDSTRFTRQDGVEETWRIFQPLLDSPPPVHPYAPGTWGPAEADELLAGFGTWRGPWVLAMSPARSSRAKSSAAPSANASASTEESEPAMPQSAAMPSPFPPIADYAFLSDCHTGALVAPDGSDRLAVRPALRRAERVRHAARPPGGRLSLRTVRHQRALGAHLRARAPTSLLTTWKTPTGWVLVRDALTLGPRRGEDLVTPHTRPPTDEDADHLLVRVAMCLEGEVEMELTCEPVFDYGRVPATWTVDEDGHRADASGADLTIRLQTDMAVGVEGDWVRARHVLKQGEQIYCSLSWAEELAAPQDIDEANAHLAATTALLARLACAGAHPRPPLARPDPALGARDQGPHLHADRRDGRGADDVAARDARRRAQLGLPLHLAARLDLHAAGAALPQPRLGGRGVHAVRRRPRAQRRRRAADHVRDRRAARPDRVHARRPLRLRRREPRADRQRRLRPAPERRLRRGARLDPAAHAPQSERLPRRLWPLVQAQAECATKVWREPDQGIWEARGKPQHYVSSKLMCWVAMDRAAKLAAMRGDCSAQEHLAGDRRGDQGGHPRPRPQRRAASCASTTRPTRSTPPTCWRRSSASCPARTSACARASWRSPTT